MSRTTRSSKATRWSSAVAQCDRAGAESGHARAPAPPRTEAVEAAEIDRAPGGHAGAVGARAVRRHLDAHDRLQAGAARTPATPGRRAAPYRDARHAAP